MNDTFANNKRKEALFEQKRTAHNKKEAIVRNVHAILDSNKECESDIRKYMLQDDGIERQHIVNAQMKHFSKGTVARLVNFILSRVHVLTDLASETKKSISMKKT